jgi:hypothetical protein
MWLLPLLLQQLVMVQHKLLVKRLAHLVFGQMMHARLLLTVHVGEKHKQHVVLQLVDPTLVGAPGNITMASVALKVVLHLLPLLLGKVT